MERISLWNLTTLDTVPAPDLPAHSSLSHLTHYLTPGLTPGLWEAVVLRPHFTARKVEARDSLARDRTARCSKPGVMPSPPVPCPHSVLPAGQMLHPCGPQFPYL